MNKESVAIKKDLFWDTKKIKISDLNPAKYNPRKISEKQKENLSNSLEKFSVVDPIIINLDNTIIGGHQRISILKSKGIDEVDVRFPSRFLEESEEKELNLRLNQNLGEWDLDLLGNFDEKMLTDVGFDLKDIGLGIDFQSVEIDEIDRLDRLKKVICPKCGLEFEPKN